jgi:hypothetical protein
MIMAHIHAHGFAPFSARMARVNGSGDDLAQCTQPDITGNAGHHDGKEGAREAIAWLGQLGAPNANKDRCSGREPFGHLSGLEFYRGAHSFICGQ